MFYLDVLTFIKVIFKIPDINVEKLVTTYLGDIS